MPRIFTSKMGLLVRVEQLIEAGQAWAPIDGSTKRCETEEKLTKWIDAQNARKRQFDKRVGCVRPASLDLLQFPESEPGKRVITTARNIAYLIDSSSVFLGAVHGAFGDVALEAAAQHLDLNRTGFDGGFQPTIPACSGSSSSA